MTKAQKQFKLLILSDLKIAASLKDSLNKAYDTVKDWLESGNTEK